jgi:hypothetical protein
MSGSVHVPPTVAASRCLSSTAGVTLIEGARTTATATDPVSLLVADETA